MKSKAFLTVLIVLTGILPLAASFEGTVMAASEPSEGPQTLKLRIWGTTTALADWLAGDAPMLASGQGVGTLGRFSTQGLYLYAQLLPDEAGRGEMLCLQAQASVVLDSTGDSLVIISDPGPAGFLQITDIYTLSFVWEQEWTGSVIGGTGRFEGAHGTFTKQLRGFGQVPGFATPWTGTLVIELD